MIALVLRHDSTAWHITASLSFHLHFECWKRDLYIRRQMFHVGQSSIKWTLHLATGARLPVDALSIQSRSQAVWSVYSWNMLLCSPFVFLHGTSIRVPGFVMRVPHLYADLGYCHVLSSVNGKAQSISIVRRDRRDAKQYFTRLFLSQRQESGLKYSWASTTSKYSTATKDLGDELMNPLGNMRIIKQN